MQRTIAPAAYCLPPPALMTLRLFLTLHQHSPQHFADERSRQRGAELDRSGQLVAADSLAEVDLQRQSLLRSWHGTIEVLHHLRLLQ